MTTDSAHLLRRLEPPVKAISGNAAQSSAKGSVDPHSFSRMLAFVSRSSGVAGRSVLSGPVLDPALNPGQMSRLAAAADLAGTAEAEVEIEHALMLIDGRAIVVNVPAREIVSELKEGSRHELVELNAAVYVAASGEGRADQASGLRSAAIPGLHSVLPPAVAMQLASMVNGDASAKHNT